MEENVSKKSIKNVLLFFSAFAGRIVSMIVVVLLLIAVVLLLLRPERTMVTTDVDDYLVLNRNIQTERSRYTEKGDLREVFFPEKQDDLTIESYCFWYGGQVLEPEYRYAVTAKVVFDSPSGFEQERKKLEAAFDSHHIIETDLELLCDQNLQERITAFLSEPILDGSVFQEQYVLISEKKQTIQYTEFLLIEGGITPDCIDEQLEIILNGAK